ncbi:unnamed protein product [Prunus armeniaca]
MFFRAILISTSLCFVQSVMPEDALLGAWKKSAHKLWVKRLRRTSSLAELLQVLGDFVGAINEDRLYECNIEQVALWLVRLDALIAPYLERAHSQKRLEISVRGFETVEGVQKLGFYLGK